MRSRERGFRQHWMGVHEPPTRPDLVDERYPPAFIRQDQSRQGAQAGGMIQDALRRFLLSKLGQYIEVRAENAIGHACPCPSLYICVRRDEGTAHRERVALHARARRK